MQKRGKIRTVVAVTFFLIRLAPGGPFTAERNYPEEAIQRMNEFYGLDDPLPIQYLNYLASAIRGQERTALHRLGVTRLRLSLRLGS